MSRCSKGRIPNFHGGPQLLLELQEGAPVVATPTGRGRQNARITQV